MMKYVGGVKGQVRLGRVESSGQVRSSHRVGASRVVGLQNGRVKSSGQSISCRGVRLVWSVVFLLKGCERWVCRFQYTKGLAKVFI